MFVLTPAFEMTPQLQVTPEREEEQVAADLAPRLSARPGWARSLVREESTSEREDPSDSPLETRESPLPHERRCPRTVDHARLYGACASGDLNALQDLLDGARAHSLALDTSAALMRACSAGHDQLASLLIEHGASVTYADHDGFTALLEASGEGHLACVSLLLERKACANWCAVGGTGALKLACDNGHREVAALLCDHGASPHQRTDGSETVLMSASRMATSGFGSGCVRLLLERSAQVNARTDDGESALSISLRCGLGDTLSIVQLLVANGAERCPLVWRQADGAVLRWLLRTEGWSPLHYVAQLSESRARALLEAGADIHLTARPPSARFANTVSELMAGLDIDRYRLQPQPTPLQLAQQLQDEGEAGGAARAVLDAALTWNAPWTPATHATFAAPSRALARSLHHVGLWLSRSGAFEGHEQAFVDVWIDCVMSLVVRRSA